MSTPFQQALSDYISAERDYSWALHPANQDADKDVGAADKALSRAGDALESVLRQMMREEVAKGGTKRANVFERG